MRTDSYAEYTSLARLAAYLDGLSAKHSPALQKYYKEPAFVREYKATDVKLASTATSLLSLHTADRWYSTHEAENQSKTHLILDYLLESAPQKNIETARDLYHAAYALRAINPFLEREEQWTQNNRAGLRHLRDLLVDKYTSFDRAHKTKDALSPSPALTESGYIWFLVLDALRPHIIKKRPFEVPGGIKDWSEREVNRNIILLQDKSGGGDAAQLGYCLLISRGFSDWIRATPEQKHLMRAAIGAFFGAQREDGLWPTGGPQPISSSGGVAYCYDYELLAHLLDCDSLEPLLLEQTDRLEKSARALAQMATEIGEGALAWQSGHQSTRGPESWSTASVYHFLHGFRRLVAERIRRATFECLGQGYTKPHPMDIDDDKRKKAFGQGFVDCPVPRQYGVSLIDVLYDRFVLPMAKAAPRIARRLNVPSGLPTCGILFGPPGTSKTDLAKRISEAIGWPLLEIDPSVLVDTGMDGVVRQANQLFGMIEHLEQVVVLLDEIDELVRDRGQADEVLSRLLTTSLLPKLARINKTRRVIVLVATNYVERFDLAIRRRGRFDFVVQVMPPSLSAKKAILSEKKIDIPAGKDIEDALELLTYSEFEDLLPALEIPEDDIPQSIRRAAEQCTLASPGDHDLKWKEVCDREARHVRFSGDAPDEHHPLFSRTITLGEGDDASAKRVQKNGKLDKKQKT